VQVGVASSLLSRRQLLPNAGSSAAPYAGGHFNTVASKQHTMMSHDAR
jgi:hypothetical protein